MRRAKNFTCKSYFGILIFNKINVEQLYGKNSLRPEKYKKT